MSWTDTLKEELGELGIDNEITITLPEDGIAAPTSETGKVMKSWEEELEIELKAELEDFEPIPNEGGEGGIFKGK